MQSGAICTGLPRSSLKRCAAGARLYFLFTSPFGRPRCDMRMTAAPLSNKYCMVGSDARMRLSSVICRSASTGALKSTRTSTRFPAASISRTVFLFIQFVPTTCYIQVLQEVSLKAFFREEMDEIGNAARVAPLVVIPGDNLDHVPANDHRRKAINDRGVGVTPEIGRTTPFLCIIENALERTRGSLLVRVVHSSFGVL